MTDTNGYFISYIPVSLDEGEVSPAYVLRVTPESASVELRATEEAEAALWGRIAPGAFQNLSENPIDLGGSFPGFADVEIEVRAAENVPGLTRKNIFLGAYSGKPAGWML